MKRLSTIFFQALIILIGIMVLAFMVRFPLTEGRAANLDLLSIYTDPFIVYGYLASIAFFIMLYQAFKLLGYIRQHKAFSNNSVKALRIIKYCAIMLSVLILVAGLYIRIFHAKDDDPAGFLALCIMAIFILAIIYTATNVLGKIVQKSIDLKSENDLIV